MTGPTGGSFDRLDECLPFPIPENARQVLTLAPDVLALSDCTLGVTALPGKNDEFTLKINGVSCGTFTRKQLSLGINLTDLPADPKAKVVNPIAAQSKAILDAVAAKEGAVGEWRGLSQKAHAKGADPKLKDDLALLTKKVEAADEKIREAATPKTLHFEVIPTR